MKISCIFAVFALGVFVEGALWAAAVQPILLSFGAVFAALNIDAQPFLDVDWKNLLIFKKDKKKVSKDVITKAKEQYAAKSDREKELDELYENSFTAKYIDPKKQEFD